MSEAFIIGLDIAKYVFHAHGVDERGRAIFSKRISRPFDGASAAVA